MVNLDQFFPSYSKTQTDNVYAIIKLFVIFIILALLTNTFIAIILIVLLYLATFVIPESFINNYNLMNTHYNQHNYVIDEPIADTDIESNLTVNIPVPLNSDDIDVNNRLIPRADERLYYDNETNYDKINFERQFFSLPNRAEPNNLVEFGKWLFDQGPTCKEGGFCGKYDQLRTPLYRYD